jgi:hypothetical protein
MDVVMSAGALPADSSLTEIYRRLAARTNPSDCILRTLAPQDGLQSRRGTEGLGVRALVKTHCQLLPSHRSRSPVGKAVHGSLASSTVHNRELRNSIRRDTTDAE